LDGNSERKARSNHEGSANGNNAAGRGARVRFFLLVRVILQEIFDEAAYKRFCVKEGLGVGRESYAKFLAEGEKASQIKVRCC
jgi:hypothetical protein